MMYRAQNRMSAVMRRSRPVGLSLVPSTAALAEDGQLYFSDGFESGDFSAWTAGGSLSVGTASPYEGAYHAYVNRTNGDSGINGCYKQYGTAGQLSTFIRDFAARFYKRWATFTGGWPSLNKCAIFQYHEAAVGPGSNSTRKYQIIVDVNSSGYYVIELLHWDADGTGDLLESATVQQSTAGVTFDEWDEIELEVTLDTNGSGGLGSGHGNGILKLRVNGQLVINDSTVNFVNGNTTVGMGRIFCAGPTSWTSGNTTQSWDLMQVASDLSGLSPVYKLANWRNSQITLQWVYPYTDAASSSHWRHRRCPTDPVGDNPWIVPLAVMGGGYPYNFTILDGPPGLRVVYVGFDVAQPPYYAYLQLDDPQAGTYNVSVRATDQNGDHVDQTWTLEVAAHTDTAKFLYLNSATGNNGNSGTRASPKADIAGWYLGNPDDATHTSKQVFYVGGEYFLSDAGTGAVEMNASKPETHWGIGSVAFHGDGGHWRVDTDGYCFGNITHNDSLIGGDSNHHIQSFSSKFTAFKYHCVGSGTASADSTNSSCFNFLDTGTVHSKFAIVACDMSVLRGHQAGVKTYNVYDMLVEGCTFSDSSGGNVLLVHDKGGDIRRVPVRGCKAVTSISGTVFRKAEFINSPILREDLETSWCSFQGDNLFLWMKGQGGDNFNRIDSFRNNQQPTFSELDADSGTVTFEDDVIQHNGVHTNGLRDIGDNIVTAVDLVTGTSGLLDGTTNLKIGGPDGTHGCELVFL